MQPPYFWWVVLGPTGLGETFYKCSEEGCEAGMDIESNSINLFWTLHLWATYQNLGEIPLWYFRADYRQSFLLLGCGEFAEGTNVGQVPVLAGYNHQFWFWVVRIEPQQRLIFRTRSQTRFCVLKNWTCKWVLNSIHVWNQNQIANIYILTTHGVNRRLTANLGSNWIRNRVCSFLNWKQNHNWNVFFEELDLKPDPQFHLCVKPELKLL